MFHKVYFFRSFFLILFIFFILFFFSFKFFIDFSKIIDEEYVIFFAISLVAFLLGSFAISSVNSILNERISYIEAECKKNYDSLIFNSNNLRNLYIKFMEFNRLLISYFSKSFSMNLNFFANVEKRSKLFFKFSFSFYILKEVFLNYFFSFKKFFVTNINKAFSRWISIEKNVFRIFFLKRLRFLEYIKMMIKLRNNAIRRMHQANINYSRYMYDLELDILFVASKRDPRWCRKLVPTILMKAKEGFFKKYKRKFVRKH